MNTKILTAILLVFCFSMSYAQSPIFEIKGKLYNYMEDTIYLGYYYADKQYLIDTASVSQGGFVFRADSLKEGVYLVVMPPENKYFQVMVNDDEPYFSFSGDILNIEETIHFEGSPDNEIFYENLRFIGKKRKDVEALNSKKELPNADTTAVKEDLANINEEVKRFQKGLVDSHPASITAALIKSGTSVDLPGFEGTPEEIRLQQYLYFKKHYFDHVDLTDDRLIRAPQHVMYDRINYYMEKLTPQHPDSLIQSIDYLLNRMEGGKENYRFFLIKFLNDFAQSKIVGMDAVYVHLALNYYAMGKTPWIEESQLQKIVQNAKDAEPTLIGKYAPNIKLQLRDSSDINLYDIKSEYTIVVFWAHDCGHCKESMPQLKEFYNQHAAEKGIQVFSVCTKVLKDEPPCWDFIDERNLNGWINASDQNGGRSYMHSLFNIKKTPKLFVLDKDKKILSKDLGPEQLEEYFDHLIKPQN
ncbi:MAG: DUF5106 domain-containing protein [Saprospiraceae bacterium]|nr:DUF5106 domain-containing protein [Saprospiraceae bacterium]